MNQTKPSAYHRAECPSMLPEPQRKASYAASWGHLVSAAVVSQKRQTIRWGLEDILKKKPLSPSYSATMAIVAHTVCALLLTHCHPAPCRVEMADYPTH